MSKNVGAYVHIPFCAKKCTYCDFVSYDNKTELIDRYIDALKNEIKSTNEKYIIKTIYIGGGTPSFINSTYIEEILSIIKQNWNVKKSAEITIEVNPGTVNREKLKTYYKSGINRISIGMQSSNDKELKLIGRIHTYEKFLGTYKLAQEVGFSNINVDVIIGLPEQTIEDVNDTIDKIIKLDPKHISVYSLMLEEGTKLYNDVEAGLCTCPNDDIERDMYWSAKKKLEKVGYIHYEISNFAKDGYESKHNLDCWNQKEYLGFGLAAHSYINNMRYSNTANLKEYCRGGFPYPPEKTIHEIQTKESKMKEYMLLGLRKIDGMKISEFKNKFIDNPVYLYRDELNKLVEQGLVKIDIDDIELTNKGIDLANQVWQEFA